MLFYKLDFNNKKVIFSLEIIRNKQQAENQLVFSSCLFDVPIF